MKVACEETMFYFAYGDNMSHRKMLERCPDSTFVSPALLLGFKLIFDGHSLSRSGAVANIVPEIEGRVWGGLYTISEKDLLCLDLYENFPVSCQRRGFTVIARDEKYDAIAYYRVGQEPGIPGKEYFDELIQGAADCELPEDYIKALKESYRYQV